MSDNPLLTPSNRQVQDSAETFTRVGTVQHEGWSKSAASFSAGGSDYYAFIYKLPGGLQYVILRADESKAKVDIPQLLNTLKEATESKREITIIGWDRIEEMPAPDDMMQHPVGADDSIPTFVIKSIQ